MLKPRIEILAKKLALEVLKAYHREIKSIHVADSSAVERERGQAAAFERAHLFLRSFSDDQFEASPGDYGKLIAWRNQRIEDE